MAQVVKNPPANTGDAGDSGLIPGLQRSPEKEMLSHFSILAWEIPWMEEPGWLQSTGSRRVGHEWIDGAAAADKYSYSSNSTIFTQYGTVWLCFWNLMDKTVFGYFSTNCWFNILCGSKTKCWQYYLSMGFLTKKCRSASQNHPDMLLLDSWPSNNVRLTLKQLNTLVLSC